MPESEDRTPRVTDDFPTTPCQRYIAMTGSEREWPRDLLGGHRIGGAHPRDGGAGWGGSRGLEALETRWLMAVLVPPKVVEERAVRNTADFVIRLERASPRPSTYSFITGGGVATPTWTPPAPHDYVLAQAQPPPSNRETTKVVPVDIIDDDLIEHDEDLLVVKGRGRTVFGRAIIDRRRYPGTARARQQPGRARGRGPDPPAGSGSSARPASGRLAQSTRSGS